MNHKICLIICIVCIGVIGCRKKTGEYGVSDRPDQFPEILTPPDNATEVWYVSPTTEKIVRGAYSLSYMLNEEYPAEMTIKQVQNHVKSYGCVRVEWMPDDFSVYHVEGKSSNRRIVESPEDSQQFRESLEKEQMVVKTKWQKPEPLADYADKIYATWNEEWITQSNDLLAITLIYLTPSNGESVNKIYVHCILFTPSSDRYPYVKKYKERHPEKFLAENDPNDIKKAPIQ